jgi:hypothetical protein
VPASLEGQLVVALSSRALFDFEEENRVFEDQDDSAYMRLQLERMDQPARPGVAFPLVQKLLAFNTPERQRVAVVILSRNDPVSGLRIFRPPRPPAWRWNAAYSPAGDRPSTTSSRWAPTSSFPPTRPTCAPRSTAAFPRRACIRRR